MSLELDFPKSTSSVAVMTIDICLALMASLGITDFCLKYNTAEFDVVCRSSKHSLPLSLRVRRLDKVMTIKLFSQSLFVVIANRMLLLMLSPS